MKFLHVFDTTKQRDWLSRGPLFVALGFAFSVLMLVGAGVFGINWGIDFAGGMEMQVKFSSVVKADDIRSTLVGLGFDKNQVQQYGSTDDNEWLLRVERMSSLSPENIASIDKMLDGALGVDARIEFRPEEGDRFTMLVPFAPAAEVDILAQQKLLEDQEALIATTLEDKSGFRLRRTIADDGKETTADAIVRDEAYQGTVKYLVQLQGISDKVKKELTAKFGAVEVRRVDFVDATVAQELKTDGVLALLISLALILVYVAIRFDMFFAPGAVIALLHDPLGALAVYVIGRMEFDLPSVAALLTTVGYSISHTIVIYDRVRETTPAGEVSHQQLREIVNKAVNDTLNRTINTTTTTLFATISLWIFAGGAVRPFAACLTIGCAIGAYSSLFMAPTIYLWFRERFYSPAAGKPKGLSREERERGVV